MGSEFLNWHLVKYFKNRKTPVGFTRSRPYHKDDNGHVEQKNWTHVRQLLAYHRIEDPELLGAINALYRDLWEPYHNFFSPSAKLIKKVRHGAKVKRKHDKPMTPCDRLLNSSDVSDEVKKKLRAVRAKLNPFKLQRQIEQALKPILQQSRFVAQSPLPNPSPHVTSPILTTVS